MKKFKSVLKNAFVKFADQHYKAFKAMYDAGICWM